MTTTVRVMARALGATVETNGETHNLGPHEDRTFQIPEGSQTFTVTQPAGEEDRASQLANEEVPGRRQNDELLGKTPPPAGKPQVSTDQKQS